MITLTDVKKIAELARLDLGVEEANKLAHDLEDILKYIETLNGANINGIDEAVMTSGTNIFRPDRAVSYDDPGALVDAAPRAEHGFIAVKKVIEK